MTGSSDETTSDPREGDSLPQAGGSDGGGDSGPGEDDEEDEDISHHQCLQCDKNFGDYDT